jgi:hypothetical protein
MTVEELKTVFDWIAVILLFLTFAAGVGVLVTGNVINERQAKQIRQFEKDLRDKDLKIAEEQLARIKLEEDLSPRLFKHQEAAIERLREFRGTSIVLQYPLDPEGKRTAEQIAFVLDGAGWKILPKINTDPNPVFREGITVGGTDRDGTGVSPVDTVSRFIPSIPGILSPSPPSAGVVLMDELNKAGIDAHTVPGIPQKTEAVFVGVGIKPSPEERKIMKHIAEIEKRIAESIASRGVPNVSDLAEALNKDAATHGTSGGRFILPSH